MTEQELAQWLQNFQRKNNRRAVKMMLRSMGATLVVLNLLLSLTIITPGPAQYIQIAVGLAMLLGSLLVKVPHA